MDQTLADIDNARASGRSGTWRSATLVLALLVAQVPAAQAWDAGKCANDDAPNCGESGRGNTHLWIVNQAIHLMRGQPRTAKVAELLMNSDCRDHWRAGLFEMDEGKYKDSWPGFATGSHFYNPTGRDYNGLPDSCPTWRVVGVTSIGTRKGECQVENGNARTNAEFNLTAAALATDTPGMCRALGRALHYFTDVTNPMHASGLSGASSIATGIVTGGIVSGEKSMLHPTYENWVGTQHNKYPADQAWTDTTVYDPDHVLVDTARRSAALVLPLTRGFGTPPFPFVAAAFSRSDAVLATSLRSAYARTATYLNSVLLVSSSNALAIRPGVGSLPKTLYCGRVCESGARNFLESALNAVGGLGINTNQCYFGRCVAHGNETPNVDRDKDKADIPGCPKGYRDAGWKKDPQAWPAADVFTRICGILPKPATPRIQQAATSASPLVGEYENHLYDQRGKNDWHYVTITRIDERNLRWTNRAGVSWTLTLTADRTKLAVGADCPYYKSGHRMATVQFAADGRVISILGPGDEPYHRR